MSRTPKTILSRVPRKSKIRLEHQWNIETHLGLPLKYLRWSAVAKLSIIDIWGKVFTNISNFPLLGLSQLCLGIVAKLIHYGPVLLSYTPWKHQKTFRFSDVFRGYRKATPGCNRLSELTSIAPETIRKPYIFWWSQFEIEVYSLNFA